MFPGLGRALLIAVGLSSDFYCSELKLAVLLPVVGELSSVLTLHGYCLFNCSQINPPFDGTGHIYCIGSASSWRGQYLFKLLVRKAGVDI